VIITSRIADWSTAVQPVELDVLAEEDAAAFLLERTESRRKKMLTDSEDAAAVARDLGGLALALEQGGAYVAKIRVSFSEYRRRWESRKEEVLAWHDERLMLYPKSVATTWQTTIEELSQSERKLLNILAWLAPEPVPLLLLEGNFVDGADARDALAGLARLRRFAGVKVSKCLKIRGRTEKVCTTTDLIDQFASCGNSWFRLSGKPEI
jgi:hypothetical protein